MYAFAFDLDPAAAMDALRALPRRPLIPEPTPVALVNVIVAVAPCDDCRLRSHCSTGLLACGAFATFVHGRPERLWRLAPRAPDRRVYLALFDGSDTESCPSPAYEAHGAAQALG